MITVLGSINIDLVATAERLPRSGETVAGSALATVAGGKGANQALAVCRAGHPVRMVGAVGEDAFAGLALALLREAGADLGFVRQVGEPTGTALILVGGDGENMITVIPGANGFVGEADIEASLSGMGAGDILMLQFEIPAPVVEQALKAARAGGVLTILNIAPLVPETVGIAALADIVVANETEFERLAGASLPSAEAREDALRRLHAETGQTIVVTLGGDGAMAMEDGVFHQVRSLPITPVDTVGAGDTFCGYLAAGIARGDGLHRAMRDAATAGSLACLSRGAQSAMPLRVEVDAALAGLRVSA
jgi:ribokinase